MRKISVSFLLVILSIYTTAQPSNYCQTSEPVCASSPFNFEASINGLAQEGPFYGCLLTQPNPSWFHFRIATPGDIELTLFSEPQQDIDFILWGPFEDPYSPCQYGLTVDKVVSCSYSSLSVETCNIPCAEAQAYYVLLITNYSSQPCRISFQQTGGTGATDCSIMPSRVSSNSPVCSNDTLRMYAEDLEGAGYQWFGPDGFVSDEQNPVFAGVTLDFAGEYYCIISLNNLHDTSYTWIDINSLPEVFLSGDQVVCHDTPAYLHFTMSGEPPFTVVYTDQENDYSFTCYSDDTIAEVWPSGDVTYSVISFSDAFCQGTILQEDVFIDLNEEITVHGLEFLCDDTSATYQVSFEIQGGDPESYTVVPGSGVISPEPPFVFSSDPIPVGTPYCFSVSDQMECAPATVYGVQFCQCDVTAILSGQDNICRGDTTWIAIALTGIPPWNIILAEIPVEGGDTLFHSLTSSTPVLELAVHPGTSCRYMITFVSDVNCQGSPSGIAQVTVHPVPLADFSWSLECLGNPTLFMDQTVIQRESVIEWSWDFGDGAGVSVLKNPRYIYSSPGTYPVSLEVVTDHSCSARVTRDIRVYPGLNVEMPENITVAYGTVMDLNAAVSPSGSGVLGYSWEPAQWVTQPDQLLTATKPLTESVEFTLHVTDQVTQCEANASRIVWISGQSLSAHASAILSEICLGSATRLIAEVEGGTGSYSYHWTSDPPGYELFEPAPFVEPLTSTIFYLEVNDGITTAIAEIVIEVHEIPLVETENSLDILYGTCTTLYSRVSGGLPPYAYDWSPSELLMDPHAEDPSTVVLTVPVVFNLMVTDALGCQGHDQVQIDITGAPLTASIETYPPDPVCSGDSVQLKAIISGGNGTVHVTWKDESGNEIGEKPECTIAPQRSGSYYIEVTDGYASYVTSADVIVMPAPVISLNPEGYSPIDDDTLKVCVYDDLFIHAGSPDHEYHWFDGSSGPDLYLTTGGIGIDVRKIWVKATDRENGCTATDSLVIEYGFSQCVGVGDDWPGRLIGVYPNPVNEVLYLETRDLECELKVILTNLAGQGVLPPIEISPHTGSSIFPVQVETLPGGIYLLRMLSESYVHVEKIIIH